MRKSVRGRRFLAAAAALTAAIAGTVSAAGPARAGGVDVRSNMGVYVYNGVSGGSGRTYHIDDGDTFTVSDYVADGYGVQGFLLNTSGTILASAYNGKGAGTQVSFAYDVKAGVYYTMKVCLVDGPDHVRIKCETKVITE